MKRLFETLRIMFDHAFRREFIEADMREETRIRESQNTLNTREMYKSCRTCRRALR